MINKFALMQQRLGGNPFQQSFGRLPSPLPNPYGGANWNGHWGGPPNPTFNQLGGGNLGPPQGWMNQLQPGPPSFPQGNLANMASPYMPVGMGRLESQGQGNMMGRGYGGFPGMGGYGGFPGGFPGFGGIASMMQRSPWAAALGGDLARLNPVGSSTYRNAMARFGR